MIGASDSFLCAAALKGSTRIYGQIVDDASSFTLIWGSALAVSLAVFSAGVYALVNARRVRRKPGIGLVALGLVGMTLVILGPILFFYVLGDFQS